MSRPPVAIMHDGETRGYWRVQVYEKGLPKDVTTFRGAPTEITSMTETDPFGPAEATVRFPSITVVEPYGSGALSWFAPERDIDISWVVVDEDDVHTVVRSWEGFMGSFDYSAIGVSVSCVGALREYDNYLAMPRYLVRPLAYERAIADALTRRVGMRMMKQLKVQWPAGWSKKFSSATFRSEAAALKGYMLPLVYTAEGNPSVGGLVNWTGLVTRETGRFENVLTSYVQGVLQNMQAPQGPWTLQLEEGRQPVLRVRTRPTRATAGIPIIDLVNPGIQDWSLRYDHTQKVNVVYGQGKTQAGSTFTGMRISLDKLDGAGGAEGITTYDPFAALPQVHPEPPKKRPQENRWFDQNVMRKEVSIPFTEGLNEAEAQIVAQLHLSRYADPGYTATVRITQSLAVTGGSPTRLRTPEVRAGMSFLVKNLFGNADGVLMHATESQMDANGDVTLTLDSRYRDQLTVAEVRRRGRDSLRPARMLTVGSFEPMVPDLLFPWSYSKGAGYVPARSKKLWRASGPNPRAYESYDFPWTELTTEKPPRDNPDMYIRIRPTNYKNATANWATMNAQLTGNGYPVILSSAGDIRMIQMAAYDADGNVLPVRFHVSLYYDNLVVPKFTMPVIPVGSKDGGTTQTQANAILKAINHKREKEGVLYHYKAGQKYPFFPNAFNSGFNADGTKVLDDVNNVTDASLIVGWGNGYEQCGYWPSTEEAGGEPTGMFVDETPWSYSFADSNQRRFNVATNGGRTVPDQSKPNIVKARLMVYCDEQDDQPVFFLGRIYRAEPGQN